VAPGAAGAPAAVLGPWRWARASRATTSADPLRGSVAGAPAVGAWVPGVGAGCGRASWSVWREVVVVVLVAPDGTAPCAGSAGGGRALVVPAMVPVALIIGEAWTGRGWAQSAACRTVDLLVMEPTDERASVGLNGRG
jgi:hypothetical protein